MPTIIFQSIGTPANYEKAFQYFLLAAKKGNNFAKGYLGWMYAGGRGTDLDYKLGFRWTNEAAKENNNFAIANLGWHYHLGLGVEKDLKLAEEYYLKAANQGNEFAKEQLALISGSEAIEKYEKIKKDQIINNALLQAISSEGIPIEEEFIVLKNTNVRSLPDINSDKIGMLEKDSIIYVSGKYKDWYIIEINNKFGGFVYSIYSTSFNK